MSLPNDFESVIKEEYGDFGWELANSFSFIAEFVGYRVFDISAVEMALKIIEREIGCSLSKQAHLNDLPKFFKKYYPRIHKVFIKRAKNIKDSHEDVEYDRKEAVSDKFAEYAISKNPDIFRSIASEFFRDYVMFTLGLDMFEWLLEIDQEINRENDINF